MSVAVENRGRVSGEVVTPVTFSRSPRPDAVYRLVVEQWFAKSREEVFEFFSDAYQLEAITPPWLNFQVQTPAPIPMASGTLIDYRLKLHGIPLKWRTLIQVWEPPFRFVDLQLKGPYLFWHHEHLFEERNGGTLVRDIVDYKVPFGSLVNRFFVQPDLQRIFGYRVSQLQKLLS